MGTLSSRACERFWATVVYRSITFTTTFTWFFLQKYVLHFCLLAVTSWKGIFEWFAFREKLKFSLQKYFLSKFAHKGGGGVAAICRTIKLNLQFRKKVVNWNRKFSKNSRIVAQSEMPFTNKSLIFFFFKC